MSIIPEINTFYEKSIQIMKKILSNWPDFRYFLQQHWFDVFRNKWSFRRAFIFWTCYGCWTIFITYKPSASSVTGKKLRICEKGVVNDDFVWLENKHYTKRNYVLLTTQCDYTHTCGNQYMYEHVPAIIKKFRFQRVNFSLDDYVCWIQ